MFESYIFFALGSAFFSASRFLLTKHILKNILRDVFVFLIYSSVITALLFSASWLFVPLAVPSETGFIYLIAASLLMWDAAEKFQAKNLDSYMVSDLSIERLKGLMSESRDTEDFLGKIRELRSFAGRTAVDKIPGFSTFDDRHFFTPAGVSVKEKLPTGYGLNNYRYRGILERGGPFSQQYSLEMKPVGQDIAPEAAVVSRFLKSEARKAYNIPKRLNTFVE